MPFDLLVDYYEDMYEDSPHAMLDAMRGEDGEIVLTDTGDPLIDKWEAELSKGLMPDLEEGMSEESRQRLHAERKKIPAAQKALEAALTNERFDQPPKKSDRRFESKFARRGSAEERALLGTKAAGERQSGKQQPRTLGDEVTRGR